MATMEDIQNEILGIINSHHTIPAVSDDNSTNISKTSVEYKYEARVFYTNNNTTTMINYFRINKPCNFDYFKSDLGWEQKNGNYVPVKYNCKNDSTNYDFTCMNGDKPILDNDTNNNKPSATSPPPAFIMANIERNDLVDAQIHKDTQIAHLGLKLENGNISPKKFFSVVTSKNGDDLTKICGFHTADYANKLKIQFFDTTAGKYILKYKVPVKSSSSSTHMKLILCQIPNNGGGGKRKKKTPSARSKKRSKTSQTKTLKKH